MNKKYTLALIVVIFFSLTTIAILSLFRDPLRARSIGITDTLAIILVVANFICLAASIIFFLWQRAHKYTPAHDAVETLEVFAAQQLQQSTAPPEAIIIDNELLSQLTRPYEVVTIPSQEYLSAHYLQISQTIKLTSNTEPKQYVIVEVINLSDDAVIVRSIS